MRILAVVLCGFVYSYQGISQKIVGRILDQKTGKPISNVTLTVKQDTLSAETNYLGFFEILIRKENPIILASHISYEDVEVNVGGKEKILFSMSPHYKELPQLNLIGFSEEKAYDIDSTELYEYEDYFLDGSDTIRLANNNAKFSGGAKGLFNYFGRSIKYDSLEKFENAVSLFVKFTVEKDGSVKDVITSGDTLGGLSEMVINSFLEMPKWKPARQGVSVTSQYFVIEILMGNEIYLVVEESASFPGGMNAFYEFVGKNLVSKGYPREARRMGIEGKVFVQFVVERDGKIDPQSIFLMKGIGGGCDELALSVIKDSPPWNPGTQRGKSVRQRMVIPIFFKLN